MKWSRLICFGILFSYSGPLFALTTIKINLGKTSKKYKIPRQVTFQMPPPMEFGANGQPLIIVTSASSSMPADLFTANASSETFCAAEIRSSFNVSLVDKITKAFGPNLPSLAAVSLPQKNSGETADFDCNKYFKSGVGVPLQGTFTFTCVNSSWQLSSNSCSVGCGTMSLDPPPDLNGIATKKAQFTLTPGAEKDKQQFLCSDYLQVTGGGSVGGLFQYECKDDQWQLAANSCGGTSAPKAHCDLVNAAVPNQGNAYYMLYPYVQDYNMTFASCSAQCDSQAGGASGGICTYVPSLTLAQGYGFTLPGVCAYTPPGGLVYWSPYVGRQFIGQTAYSTACN